MGEDRFTEVTRQSWFERIKQALTGVVIGLILFVVALPLLFWNEGRAVKTAKRLDEGARAVVSVSVDRVDPANVGRLVHVTGRALTNQVLADPVFRVSSNAIKLERAVEVYQWKESSRSETKEKLGGGSETVTEYSYAKVWSKDLIDSTAFKQPAGHGNPSAKPFEDRSAVADNVTLGAFVLSKGLVTKMMNFDQLPVTAEIARDLPEELQGRTRVHDGRFYLGADPATPKVGDARISFQIVRPSEVSVIARQVGNTFEPYRAKAGGNIELLAIGSRSADEMFAQAQAENVILTWVLRFVGFLLMLIGLRLVFEPLAVVAGVIPILGSLIRAGTFFFAALVAAAVSLVTIAIGWVFYRPVIGIPLLIMGIGLVLALRYIAKRKQVAVVVQKEAGTSQAETR